METYLRSPYYTRKGENGMRKSEHIVQLTFHKSGNVYFKLTVTRDRSRQYFNFVRYIRTIDNLLQIALLRDWRVMMCFLSKDFSKVEVLFTFNGHLCQT